MMTISNVSVAFGAVTALDALNAELTADVTGLIGPNGAGKTTLLNVLTGFLTPTSGEVRLAGERIDRLTPRARVFRGLRRAFQQELIALDLTLRDNLRAVADNLCRSGAQAEVDAAMTFVGLKDAAETPGAKLDHFQRRLTEVAKTLIGAPKLILLDEPGAGVNEIEARRLGQILKAIPAAYGARVLLIDHDAELIAAVCQETLVLDFGRLLAFGKTAEVLRDPAVLTAYLGRRLAT